MTNNKNDLKEKLLQEVLRSLETFSIDKLEDIIVKSEKEKREYGIIFCGETNTPPFGKITHSDLCIGEECSVNMIDCKGKRQIGTFHTHPRIKMGRSFGNLSGEDIYNTIRHDDAFSCIGITEYYRPAIKCFTPKFDINPTIVSNAHNAEDDYGEKLAKVLKQRSNIDRKSVDDLIEAFEKRKMADNELKKESESLSEKLLSKEADLTIRRQTAFKLWHM
jgi:hypothetical protein